VFDTSRLGCISQPRSLFDLPIPVFRIEREDGEDAINAIHCAVDRITIFEIAFDERCSIVSECLRLGFARIACEGTDSKPLFEEALSDGSTMIAGCTGNEDL